jgi:hypothetical protein
MNDYIDIGIFGAQTKDKDGRKKDQSSLPAKNINSTGGKNYNHSCKGQAH